MSISFKNEMGQEASELIKEFFNVTVMDGKTALGNNMNKIHSKQMKAIANAAKQPVSIELNKVGDRKDVGGIIYELDEVGWKRLPIGTTL